NADCLRRSRRLALWFVFFFQAEDGIRGLYVTGVQTCALPISSAPKKRPSSGRTPSTEKKDAVTNRPVTGSACGPSPRLKLPLPRSEERRVGKERRCRWSPQH